VPLVEPVLSLLELLPLVLPCELPEPPVPLVSLIEPLVSRLELVVPVRDGEPEGFPVPCASDGALPPVPRDVADVPLPRSDDDWQPATIAPDASSPARRVLRQNVRLIVFLQK